MDKLLDQALECLNKLNQQILFVQEDYDAGLMSTEEAARLSRDLENQKVGILMLFGKLNEK